MVKSIHIPSALAFFIYTGKAPLHKRAEIYGRKAASRASDFRSDESECQQLSFESIFPLPPSFSPKRQLIIHESERSRNSKAKVHDLFCTLVERKSRSLSAFPSFWFKRRYNYDNCFYKTNNFNPNDRFSGEFEIYFSLAETSRKIIMYHIIFQFSRLYIFRVGINTMSKYIYSLRSTYVEVRKSVKCKTRN